MQGRKEISLKAVGHMQQQAVEAGARNEIAEARANLHRAKELVASLEEFGTLEDMRLACWRFTDPGMLPMCEGGNWHSEAHSKGVMEVRCGSARS